MSYSLLFYEIIEFDELLEAIEYCEEAQCGSSGNAKFCW